MMTLFSCLAYSNIRIKIRNGGDVVYMCISPGDGEVNLTLNPMQAKAMAEGLNSALAAINIPDIENSAYFGDAAVTYENMAATLHKETGENTDEKELEIEDESVETEPLAGAA